MAVDPQLLTQALRTPAGQDVVETPVVRAVILTDPKNAGDLVPALARGGTLEARNARRILCQFKATAVPHLMAALSSAPGRARKEGLEVLWAMLTGEPSWTVRDAFAASEADLVTLLRDVSDLPDEMPEHIERDFRGRICDLAYVVLGLLLDPGFDQSTFRAMDDPSRDEAIRQLIARGFSHNIA